MKDVLTHYSYSELVYWRIFFNSYPFSGYRADNNAALISSWIYNMHRDPKKSRSRDLSFFRVKYGGESEKIDTPEKAAIFERQMRKGFISAGLGSMKEDTDG